MKDLKIIAIRPLEHCNKKFLKVLKESVLYKFYNDYKFIFSDDGTTVTNVIYNPTVPSNLYSSSQHNYHLNISAIVGKNGSGKSSIVELLYATIYNMAVHRGILKGEEDQNLQYIERINIQIFYALDESIFSLTLRTKPNQETTAENIIISLDSININDKAENRSFKLVTILDDYKTLFYEFFFYTVAINYSIYSLNSLNIGEWITSLFHKNDGYKTPIVINPMRTEGKIDINVENYLVKQRLLSNLLEPVKIDFNISNTLRNIADGKNVSGLRLSYSPEKFEQQIPLIQENTKKYKINDSKFLEQIYKSYFKQEFMDEIDGNPESQLVQYYVVNKVIKICERYNNYKKFIKNGEIVEIEKLSLKLTLDNSHVTFKLKQALNYLKYRLYIDYQNHAEKTFDIEQLSIKLNKLRSYIVDEVGHKVTLIELLPPAFFDIDIIVNDNQDFDDLSSGEKQKIYSISSIVYHLLNLNSIENNGDVNDENFKYKYVNIIFDEVELYFHPDLQRTFIRDLINYLDKINTEHINNLRGLNITFVTHSPFILSDIPHQNILKLHADGAPYKYEESEKTFAANVHELLATEFYMKEGFVGGWSKDKILELVEFLKSEPNPKNEKAAIKINAQFLINMVGEPLIKERLQALFDKKYSLKNKERIIAQIEKLNLELTKIQNEENTN